MQILAICCNWIRSHLPQPPAPSISTSSGIKPNPGENNPLIVVIKRGLAGRKNNFKKKKQDATLVVELHQ